MSERIRYFLFVAAGAIILVLLPLAQRCVDPHGIETVGPPSLDVPTEPLTPVLNPGRGPGTGHAEGEDPALAVRPQMVFSQRASEMPPAQFNHLQHAARDQLDIACTDCHHKSEGTQVNFGCSMCHRDVHTASMFSAKAAQHKSCIGCHLTANASEAGLRNAPTACEGCHIP
jgi:hypothetical protein